MTRSIKGVCDCIGLKGNVSILKNFFGYHNVPGTIEDPPGFILPPLVLRLMTGNGTGRLTVPIPTLTNDEIDDMKDSGCIFQKC